MKSKTIKTKNRIEWTTKSRRNSPNRQRMERMKLTECMLICWSLVDLIRLYVCIDKPDQSRKWYIRKCHTTLFDSRVYRLNQNVNVVVPCEEFSTFTVSQVIFSVKRLEAQPRNIYTTHTHTHTHTKIFVNRNKLFSPASIQSFLINSQSQHSVDWFLFTSLSSYCFLSSHFSYSNGNWCAIDLLMHVVYIVYRYSHSHHILQHTPDSMPLHFTPFHIHSHSTRSVPSVSMHSAYCSAFWCCSSMFSCYGCSVFVLVPLRVGYYVRNIITKNDSMSTCLHCYYSTQ